MYFSIIKRIAARHFVCANVALNVFFIFKTICPHAIQRLGGICISISPAYGGLLKI